VVINEDNTSSLHIHYAFAFLIGFTQIQDGFLEHLWAGKTASGGASAVKEPGYFEVRKSSSQVTRMHFFLEKVNDLFSCRPRNTGRQRRFSVEMKQIKRSDMVILIEQGLTRVVNCPVFPGKSRILGSVSRVPGYTFPGRKMSRIFRYSGEC